MRRNLTHTKRDLTRAYKIMALTKKQNDPRQKTIFLYFWDKSSNF